MDLLPAFSLCFSLSLIGGLSLAFKINCSGSKPSAVSGMSELCRRLRGVGGSGVRSSYAIGCGSALRTGVRFANRTEGSNVDEGCVADLDGRVDEGYVILIGVASAAKATDVNGIGLSEPIFVFGEVEAGFCLEPKASAKWSSRNLSRYIRS